MTNETKATETILTPKLIRTFEGASIRPVTRADDDTTPTSDEPQREFEIAFSSEEPAVRFDWWEGEFFEEVLGHDEDEVDMSFLGGGRAPMLKDHDMRIQTGVLTRSWVADQHGHTVVKFSRNAIGEAERIDVADGIRQNVSVGYRINEMEKVGERDGRKIYRVTDWTPLEVSIVSIPLDRSEGVGVGRSGDGGSVDWKRGEVGPRQFETRVIHSRGHDMNDKVKGTDVRVEVTPPPNALSEAEVRAMREDQIKAENTRCSEIQALARRHGRSDLAEQHIKDGTTIERFRGVLLDALDDDVPLETPDAEIGMGRNELREYSLVRAMNYLLNPSDRGERDKAGFEIECSRAVEDKAQAPSPKGIYIPYDVQRAQGADFDWSRYARALELKLLHRDLSVGTDSAGGYLRPEDHLGASFIDVLRNNMVTRRLGARVLSGLVGNVAIPKLSAGTTSVWAASEGATTGEVNATFAEVALSPKDIGSYTDVTRRLLMQSDPSVEALVRDDLAMGAAIGIDSAAINGTGASGQPTGIRNTSGIGDVNHGTNGGAPTWALWLEFVTDVMAANAAFGSLAWAINANTWGKLASTVRVSGQDSFILQEPWTRLIGYPLEVTEQLPSNLSKGTGSNLSASVFGNWRDLILAEWGTVDLLVNPYIAAAAGSGTVRFELIQSSDVGVRHAGSFSVSDEIDTA